MPDDLFDGLRPRLFGIAYRMLGVRADAEDVLQDAWLRWDAADRATLQSAEAWLVTVVTRLAIDRLRAAKAEREHYVGWWLPEPIVEVDERTPESAAELASGKLGARPLVRIRGLAERVLPAGEHGPGAQAIIRPRELDLFSLGTREAVVAAVVGDREAFGAPAGADEMLTLLDRLGLTWSRVSAHLLVDTPDAAVAERCAIAVHAYGWQADPGVPHTRIRPQ